MKKVQLVQFGPKEHQKFSEYHSYYTCKDNDVGVEPAPKSFIRTFLDYIWDYLKSFFVSEGDPPSGKGKFGENSCNHGTLVMNRQFLEYVRELMLSYENKPKEEKSIMISDEIAEQLIYDCLPVTCHRGVDECFQTFLTLANGK